MSNARSHRTMAVRTVITSILWSVGFALTTAPALAQSGPTPAQARAIAKEAYVYPTFRTRTATISHFGKRLSSEAGIAPVSKASGRE